MPNRTVCNVLEEIRVLDKTKNYSSLLSLVEEVQSMVNRMESALWDQNDYKYAKEKLKDLKEEIKVLKSEKVKLGGKNSILDDI